MDPGVVFILILIYKIIVTKPLICRKENAWKNVHILVTNSMEQSPS
jgi:hypothetical protein